MSRNVNPMPSPACVTLRPLLSTQTCCLQVSAASLLQGRLERGSHSLLLACSQRGGPGAQPTGRRCCCWPGTQPAQPRPRRVERGGQQQRRRGKRLQLGSEHPRCPALCQPRNRPALLPLRRQRRLCGRREAARGVQRGARGCDAQGCVQDCAGLRRSWGPCRRYGRSRGASTGACMRSPRPWTANP